MAEALGSVVAVPASAVEALESADVPVLWRSEEHLCVTPTPPQAEQLHTLQACFLFDGPSKWLNGILNLYGRVRP